MTTVQKLRDIKRWDEARNSLPGEHWLTFGAGLLLMRRAGRSRSMLARTAGRLIGGALLARAASGRDGLLQRTPSARASTADVPHQTGKTHP